MSKIDIFIFLSFLSILFFITFTKSYKFITIDYYQQPENKISNFALFIIMFYTILITTSFSILGQPNTIFHLFSTEQIYSYILKTLIIYHLINKIFLYKKHLSIGDIIGQSYGSWSKFITGICGFCFCVILIILQFKLIYQAINTLFTINFNAAPITIPFFVLHYIFFMHKRPKSIKSIAFLIAGPIVIYYLCSINQKLTIYAAVIIIFLYSSIARNQYAQFRSMVNFSLTIIFLPIIFSEINLINQDNTLFFHNKLTLDKFLILGEQNIKIFATIFFSILIPSLNPLLIDGIKIAQSINQAKKIFILSSIAVFIFIHIISSLTPLCKNILSIQENSLDVIKYLTEYLVHSKILKGLAFSGMISILFGIMDSIINTANIFLIQDIIKNKIFPSINKKHDTIIVIISTILIGLLCFFMSLQKNMTFNNIFGIIFNTWVSITIIPLIVCIYGFKTSKNTFLYSALIGISINITYIYN